jgi:hypothetical protein
MTGPVTNWNVTTINGAQYLVIDTASFRIPLDWDPTSNMFIAVAAPNGALGNFPALVQGAPGAPATLSNSVQFTALAAGDPTPDSASLLSLGSNQYQLVLALHDGAPGATGDMILNPTNYGTPLYKSQLQVNAALTGFEYTPEKVGDRYLPATILSCPSGNPAFTLCSVVVPPQNFDWRPKCEGYCVITGTGTDLVANLVVRMGTGTTAETAGSIVAAATQPAGQYPATHTLASAPPPGSLDAFDRVPALTSPTLYLRVERQAGTSTFTTSASTTLFSVRVMPVP